MSDHLEIPRLRPDPRPEPEMPSACQARGCSGPAPRTLAAADLLGSAGERSRDRARGHRAGDPAPSRRQPRSGLDRGRPRARHPRAAAAGGATPRHRRRPRARRGRQDRDRRRRDGGRAPRPGGGSGPARRGRMPALLRRPPRAVPHRRSLRGQPHPARARGRGRRRLACRRHPGTRPDRRGRRTTRRPSPPRHARSRPARRRRRTARWGRSAAASWCRRCRR